MRNLFSCLVFLVSLQLQAQTIVPQFLEGTWKQANKENYEHWDQVDGGLLKGMGYKMQNGQVLITEYLDLSSNEEQVIYYATVPAQNNGRRIPFVLVQSDSCYVFENKGHDFPNKITYQLMDSNTLKVTVAGNQQKGFSYLMYKQTAAAAKTKYDASLAKEMGADDYGMKGYILVLLKTGTNTTSDKKFIDDSFRGHMANINRLVAGKKLIVAGPLGKNENQYRGIFILQDAGSLEEARALLQTDPAIKANLLEAELYNWYGSAALPAYLPVSEKITKINL